MAVQTKFKDAKDVTVGDTLVIRPRGAMTLQKIDYVNIKIGHSDGESFVSPLDGKVEVVENDDNATNG